MALRPNSQPQNTDKSQRKLDVSGTRQNYGTINPEFSASASASATDTFVVPPISRASNTHKDSYLRLSDPSNPSNPSLPSAHSELSRLLPKPYRYNPKMPRILSNFCYNFSRCCVRTSILAPKVIVSTILGWSLYAEISLCFGFYWGKNSLMVLFGLLAVIFCFLSFFAYFRVVLEGPGSPCDFPELDIGSQIRSETVNCTNSDYPNDSEASATLLATAAEPQFAQKLRNPPQCMRDSLTAKDNGALRFCSKCKCWKPDRCHHCSACNKCVLRMDHHCPWFAECVGFRNHKYFVQFLVYSVIYAILCFIPSFLTIFEFLDTQEYLNGFLDLKWVFLFVLSIVFGLSVAIFTGYTCYILTKNLTTLESMEPTFYRTVVPTAHYRYNRAPSRRTVGNIYDVGWKNNVTQVLGEKWYEWLLPVKPGNCDSKGNSQYYYDGVRWPVNEQVYKAVVAVGNDEAEKLNKLWEYQRRMRGETGGNEARGSRGSVGVKGGI